MNLKTTPMQPCALDRFPGIYFFYRITGLLFVCIFGIMVFRVLFHPRFAGSPSAVCLPMSGLLNGTGRFLRF